MRRPIAEFAAHDDPAREQARVEPAILPNAERDAGEERQRGAAAGRPGDDGRVEAFCAQRARHRPQRAVDEHLREVGVSCQHLAMGRRGERDDAIVARPQRAHDRRRKQHVADPAAGADDERVQEATSAAGSSATARATSPASDGCGGAVTTSAR